MLVRLPELVVNGKRLGRNIRHDPRSLRFLLPAAEKVESVSWDRRVAIFDQGNLGSCTGNACAGALGSDPIQPTLPQLVEDEALAVSIYSDAEKLDGGVGYPPEDEGSSGLTVAKVAKNRGYVSGYLHATTVAAAHTALAAGPFLVGSYWYSDMDNPDSDGIVKVGGSIRGGHEYLCRGYDAARDLWQLDNSWGTSWGKNGTFFFDTPTFEKLLAAQGDVTSLVPVTQPAPTPNKPDPSVYSFTPDQVFALDAFAAKPSGLGSRGRRDAAAAAWLAKGTP